MRQGRLTRTMETVLVVAALVGVAALLLGYHTVALVTFRATAIVALVFLIIMVAERSRGRHRHPPGAASGRERDQ